MTKLNKLQGYGTSFDSWEKWRDIWVISPKVKNIFDFTSLYINQLEEKRGDKISAIFSSLPNSSLPLSLHLLQGFSLLKICSPSISFAFKVCFLSFYTCFSCLLWMIVDESCSNHQKFFIVMNSCLFFMEYQGFEAVY